ncbi:MAG: carbohydrate ABC transporter permease, partial [Candidatus Limiplasma sp.]|nr:carbohydrate ABC transporter permease [Candidatus Limiplasma sp.]
MTIKKLKSGSLSVFSVLLGILWLTPLVWLVGTAITKTTFNMSFLPRTALTTENLTYVWNTIPFGQYYLNTIILVVGTFLIQFFTSTLAAYSLAMFKFRGQSLVFVVIFMQIIIPNDVLIMPNFMTLSDMGLIDTKIGVMLPFLGSAMAIFL